jgi:hypothetical protein
LMAALVGAIRLDSSARADARPVRLEDRRSFERELLEAQSFERDILARGGILLAKMSGQLRGPKRTRRIRGQVTGGTDAPEPSRFGLLPWHGSARFPSYQGLSRLYRRHVAPLATGPPATVSGDRSQSRVRSILSLSRNLNLPTAPSDRDPLEVLPESARTHERGASLRVIDSHK